jgi:3-hydroxyisobutyrate dehydrogenase
MRVALIGTGLMGYPMAERVIAAGYELVVFNRTREKAEPLESLGAQIAQSTKEAIDSAECTVLMLTDAGAIKAMLFKNRQKPAFRERTVIQMGTISPEESIGLQKEVVQQGGDYFEAPVLGSTPEASAGSLLVLVGASKSQFERWSDLLKCFGPEPILIGGVGKASALKLAMNQLIAILTAGFALSLGFVQRQGIEVELFMKILRQSALYAATFDKKLQRMIDHNYDDPNFPSKHLIKDIELFWREAELHNLELSVIKGLRRLLELTKEKGHADSDYSALFKVVNPPVNN